MARFVVRVVSLFLTILSFLYLSFYLSEHVKTFPWLWQHHSVNLAYLGTFLSVLSLGFMLRKYHIIKFGRFKLWLGAHVIVGAIGILLLLVHGQYKLSALIPTVNTVLMIMIGITGLFGWHLYLTTVKSLLIEIHDMEKAEEFALARVASTAYKFWRFTHVLASITVLFMTILHILSLIIFRGQY